jgi:hypothetical protein
MRCFASASLDGVSSAVPDGEISVPAGDHL